MLLRVLVLKKIYKKSIKIVTKLSCLCIRIAEVRLKMKKLKEKTPLKYLYISSACITIILSVILYYKYTKSNVSSSKTNKDTTPFKTCTEKCPQIIDVEFKKGIQTTGTIRCSISEIGSRTLY